MLWRHGDEAVQLYLVESGDIDVSSVVANGERKRHFGIGPGAIFGEISFFLKSARVGTAAAIREAVLHGFSRDQLEARTRQQPELALELQSRVLSMEAMLVADVFHTVNFMMR